jgi:putative transposase
VQLQHRYRLDPTGMWPRWRGHSGVPRVVFSDALRARQQAHAAGLPWPTDTDLSRRLTSAKRTPERAWPAEVSSVLLQQALADLNRRESRSSGQG